MHKIPLERALYYLNNRHRLTMSDLPHYLRALQLADTYPLVCEGGRWYVPTENTCPCVPSSESA